MNVESWIESRRPIVRRSLEGDQLRDYTYLDESVRHRYFDLINGLQSRLGEFGNINTFDQIRIGEAEVNEKLTELAVVPIVRMQYSDERGYEAGAIGFNLHRCSGSTIDDFPIAGARVTRKEKPTEEDYEDLKEFDELLEDIITREQVSVPQSSS